MSSSKTENKKHINIVYNIPIHNIQKLKKKKIVCPLTFIASASEKSKPYAFLKTHDFEIRNGIALLCTLHMS